MASRSSRPAPTFNPVDLILLSSKGLCIYSHDERLGSFEIIERDDLESHKPKQSRGYTLHSIFNCDLISKASNHDIESDQNELHVITSLMFKWSLSLIAVIPIFNVSHWGGGYDIPE